MRNLKLSFALVIAVLAVGITAATKANTFGKKVIADCYRLTFNIAALNGADPRTLTLDELAAQADLDLAASPYLNQNITSTPVDAAVECPADEVFCCAKFVKLPDNTQGVSVRTINGVSGKWQVSQIFYKDIQ